MVNEFLIKQILKIFDTIAKKLFVYYRKASGGGASARVIRTALERIEKKEGALSAERIVDYVISASYTFRNRDVWTLNQIFGPKSLEKTSVTRGKRYYEDQWLAEANLKRHELLKFLSSKKSHPQSIYIYPVREESTKKRMLNLEVGYTICQISTLGWTPFSEACSECQFAERCKAVTEKKFPEIYRLRIEAYADKK